MLPFSEKGIRVFPAIWIISTHLRYFMRPSRLNTNIVHQAHGKFKTNWMILRVQKDHLFIIMNGKIHTYTVSFNRIVYWAQGVFYGFHNGAKY